MDEPVRKMLGVLAGDEDAAVPVRRAKRLAQLKLAELRFGDAVVHRKWGSGIVSVCDESACGEAYVFWLNGWRGPCGTHELAHDWDLQAEWSDIWEHASDDEWEA